MGQPLDYANLAAWYRAGIGQTLSGGLVSRWADQSGNGRDLVQATGTNQPTVQADGSILSDGVDNVMAASFTLAQPCTIYWLGKHVTWTTTDRIYDGVTISSASLEQRNAGSSPQLVMLSDAARANVNDELALDTYGVVTAVWDGASSLLQINNNAAVSGENPGTASLGGFTLGNGGDIGFSFFSHIQVKEVLLYSVAHDAATRADLVGYLLDVLAGPYYQTKRALVLHPERPGIP